MNKQICLFNVERVHKSVEFQLGERNPHKPPVERCFPGRERRARPFYFYVHPICK